ncbi:hypothetical protein L6164_016930 [Bauhinia variegata]|uniref:Uncharacterized protein n=1 Tax=Bauhinia variegata TaxID=167791 RepID=A0ACB9N6D6_BAUVA|nr:hypothetical protein L6164_016930 [Bauhinia variegata]
MLAWSSFSHGKNQEDPWRRKIEIKKITKRNNLQVTFSKRRTGIFKKASELCTLCAAQLAIIIFSPGNKVFTFGHPSISDLVNLLLNGAPAQTIEEALGNNFTEVLRNVNLRNLNAELTQLSSVLDMVKKRCTEMNKQLKAALEQFWWAGPIEEMNKPQLEFLMSTMEELNMNITLQADTLRILCSNPSQILAGSSSSPIAPQTVSQLLFQPPLVPANRVIDGNIIPPPPANHGLSGFGGFGPRNY